MDCSFCILEWKEIAARWEADNFNENLIYNLFEVEEDSEEGKIKICMLPEVQFFVFCFLLK